MPTKLTPMKAIRKHCVECCGDNTKEVKYCMSMNCPLYNYRHGKNPYTTKDKEYKSPVKVIKDKCYECSGYSSSEANKCPITTCNLHTFRNGKNSRNLSEETRKKLSEQAKRLIAEGKLGK